MTPAPVGSTTASRRRRRGPPAGTVVNLVQRQIERALEQRSRYRYVRPRVLAEGSGWKIASPNCSRNIDPRGGEIDIAWFEPRPDGRWRVHARDHAAAAWVATADSLALADALALVCHDAGRAYWR